MQRLLLIVPVTLSLYICCFYDFRVIAYATLIMLNLPLALAGASSAC